MGSARGMFPAVATLFQDMFLGGSVQSACGMFSATSGKYMYTGHTPTDYNTGHTPTDCINQFPSFPMVPRAVSCVNP